MSFSVSIAGVTLPQLPTDVHSVDISFGAERVWSIDLTHASSSRGARYEWPDVIKPFLRGHTEVVLSQSGTATQLDAVTVRFSAEDVPTRIIDSEGIPLAVNKWGRLGKTLEAGNVGVQERILDRTSEVIAHLEEMGLRPFVVGGTLLGGVRDGALLPHDDDADVAYLSRYANPVDVAAEGFAVGHKLERLGYELVRHSATHMQLYFRSHAGQLDHYVDVFSAFFSEDGHINQPFHVRGIMREDQILPFGTTLIQGKAFPAPADSESWLVINYDENWRTPIPGYRLETPRSTIRRFQSWFGSFHYTRDFWNDYYESRGVDADAPWAAGREWILAREATLRSNWLIDLGSGAGSLAAELRDRNAQRRVVAADYSPYALALAAEHGKERFTTAHVNLYRNLSLALPRDAGVDGSFDLVANHLFEHLGPHAIPKALRLVRMALRSGGAALATLHGKRDSSVPEHEPTSWAIDPQWLIERAAALGLRAEVSPLTGENERARETYGVRFTLDTSEHKENS